MFYKRVLFHSPDPFMTHEWKNAPRAPRRGRESARRRPGATGMPRPGGSALHGLPCGTAAAVPELGRIVPYLGMFPIGIIDPGLGLATPKCSR